MKELWNLFVAFMRIGGLTFGGGMAMLPMLQREVVHRYHWATDEELLNYFAIGQCTPGIIAINTATFVGYKQRKLPGAIVATAGVVFPSLVIIIILAAFLQNFAEIEAVQHAFAGIRIAVGALIVQAVIGMCKKGIKDWFGIVLAVVAFLCVVVLGLNTVWMVVLGIVIGIAAKELLRIRSDKKGGAK